MIGNPLINVLTPKVRGIAYAALFVMAVVFSAYQAAGGDWAEFIGGVITALLGLTAASNASTTPVLVEDEDGEDDAEDDLSYEESGGLPFPSDYDESALYGDGVDRGDPAAGDPGRY